ncbi:hypothetical protein [Streptacidiphilus anmyonensis]|uniref:hypothetical protein n=1 Tax=Streptacidiphilus anmyonensis TaxID=405782 RepID=UPI0005A9A20E|nr:hypothetical protein [Streptacidiphilus anmyonensis]
MIAAEGDAMGFWDWLGVILGGLMVVTAIAAATIGVFREGERSTLRGAAGMAGLGLIWGTNSVKPLHPPGIATDLLYAAGIALVLPSTVVEVRWRRDRRAERKAAAALRDAADATPRRGS